MPTGTPQAITSNRGCRVDDRRWIPEHWPGPAIAARIAAGAARASKERRAWEPAPRWPRRGEEPARAARSWAVLTHAPRHRDTRDHVSSGSRASRWTSTRPMPRPPAVATQERPASAPSPRPESWPPADSPARDPSMCAAHSSWLLVESGAGQPCRPPLWPHTRHPGLADRIGPRPLPHNAYRSAGLRQLESRADHVP